MDAKGNPVPKQYNYSPPNGVLVLHDVDGNRASIAVLLKEVTYDASGLTVIASSLDASHPLVPGDYTDVSIFVDSTWAVVFACGATVLSIIGEILTVGLDTPLTAGLSVTCISALADTYFD